MRDTIATIEALAGNRTPRATSRRTMDVADDVVANDVAHALRSDTLTAHLAVEVSAHDGVVSLRGQVGTLEDAENAEVVAGRVPGVASVREVLVVASLRRGERG